jgi:CheY-like chemotaxis protein
MARILIADDDELITELASEVLIDAGHACGWVSCASRPSYTICRWRCSLR